MSNIRKMYRKYPQLFMLMWEHSEAEGSGDDVSVIFSKVMSNVYKEKYWMPDTADGFTKEEILKDFASLIEDGK